MNVFLLTPAPLESARIFAQHDPVRARKQLLECLQILASVDHALDGGTSMQKADGSYYKAAHPHHPITKLCRDVGAMYYLTVDVAWALTYQFPDHACSRTFWAWHWKHRYKRGDKLICCRSGHEPVYTTSREEYARIMLAYLIERKGFPVSAVSQ
jgi:hypothetical protein